ncbi:hypothetical protein [Listeria sp. ILCC797]|uniref:hypothetical protein n=1 Tax=Listeria sp. ILCC797 TaxID=1918333 RepID=UPI000B58F7BC|nr:hypothetical protein [Listeria sp. ILCC797]
MDTAITWKDWMTGRELDATERAQRGAFAVLDVIPGVKALTGGVQMMRSGSRLANVSDAPLTRCEKCPHTSGGYCQTWSNTNENGMVSLKTATHYRSPHKKASKDWTRSDKRQPP